jgi:hypothetical protein
LRWWFSGFAGDVRKDIFSSEMVVNPWSELGREASEGRGGRPVMRKMVGVVKGDGDCIGGEVGLSWLFSGDVWGRNRGLRLKRMDYAAVMY